MNPDLSKYIKYHRATLADCSAATGAVVVIDVLRAFTSAAYAFASGAQAIFLTRSVEQALALRERTPGALIMGEVNGLPVQGFDFSNSPTQLEGVDLTGRSLIQRTSAGTQGVVLSAQAEALFAASFVCASATARLIQQLHPRRVTFVITGSDPPPEFGHRPDGLGDEDAACADYLEALLRGQRPDPEPFLRRVWQSPSGRQFASPDEPDFPIEDLQRCALLDRFGFAMRVKRVDGLVALERVWAT